MTVFDIMFLRMPYWLIDVGFFMFHDAITELEVTGYF